jgi:hypothetical protein
MKKKLHLDPFVKKISYLKKELIFSMIVIFISAIISTNVNAQLSSFPTAIDFTAAKPAYITTPSGTTYSNTITNCSSVITGGIQYTSSSKSWTLTATRCGKIYYSIKQGSTVRAVTVSNNKNTTKKVTAGTANACITDTVDMDYNGSSGDVIITFAGASGGSGEAVIAVTINDTTVTTVPVTFSSFNAMQQLGTIKVNWTVTGEINLNKYVVEKSADAIHFTEAGFVIATGLSRYSWIDANVSFGNSYYRIKAIDKDGSFKNTPIIKVIQNKEKVELVIAPNPVKNSTIKLQVVGLSKANYTAKIFNSFGQLITTSNIVHDGGSAVYSLQLPNAIKPGIYNLIVNSESFVITKKVIVE